MTSLPQDPSVQPVACPFCGSTKITTSAGKVDASNYWRCEACGDVWNPGRIPTSRRNGYFGR